MDRYRADIESIYIEEAIAKDIETGIKLNVKEVPVFFLDGKRMTLRSVEDFSVNIEHRIIDSEGMRESLPTDVPDFLVADDWVLFVSSTTLSTSTSEYSNREVIDEEDEDEYLKFLDLTLSDDVNDVGDDVIVEEDGLNTRRVTVTASGYQFLPKYIRVSKDTRLYLTLKVTQGFHGLYIEGLDRQIDSIGQGLSSTIVLDLVESGTYEFYCPVGDHRGLEQTGTLMVR